MAGGGTGLPLPRVRDGGGGGDASARGLSPGQSLWAAPDWPCPAPSPGTPQGGDLPYLGPAAGGRGCGRVALASLWLGSEWRSERGAWGLLGWGRCSTEVPPVGHALRERPPTFFCTARGVLRKVKLPKEEETAGWSLCASEWKTSPSRGEEAGSRGRCERRGSWGAC